MRNGTKLKVLLELYSLKLDMDNDESLHLTIINKKTGATETFIHETYTRALQMAFAYMKKELKKDQLG